MGDPEQPRLPRDFERLVGSDEGNPPHDLTVACYTFPHWHRSALNDRLYGRGWTEYVLVHGCQPWFHGHNQPRQPALGELDERDPATWETYLPLARDHGVDVFIWDCYWYEGAPVLHEALEEGFLSVVDRFPTKFAAMWTNHPWPIQYPTTHPEGRTTWQLVAPPPQSPEEIMRSMLYLLTRYCHHDSYWRLDGRPVLVIWQLGRMLRDLGRDTTARILEEIRRSAGVIGLGELHIHVSQGSEDAFGELDGLSIDSYGLYNPIVAAAATRPLNEILIDYEIAAADVVTDVWPGYAKAAQIPFLPSVSPGWDTSPRMKKPPEPSERPSTRADWPGVIPIVVDESPAAFKALIQAAFAYLNSNPEIPRVLTIGCWNEWTEGQYLLPDTRHGLGMLRALAQARGNPPAFEHSGPGGIDPEEMEALIQALRQSRSGGTSGE